MGREPIDMRTALRQLQIVCSPLIAKPKGGSVKKDRRDRHIGRATAIGCRHTAEVKPQGVYGVGSARDVVAALLTSTRSKVSRDVRLSAGAVNVHTSREARQTLVEL